MHLLTRIPTELEQFGTIPVELGPADARYRCEGVLVGRPGLGDGDEGRVGEDDVGRDLLLLSPLEAPRTKLLEQRLVDRGRTVGATSDLAISRRGKRSAADAASL